MSSRKKVVIFTSEDWHFFAHLLPIAVAAKKSGYEVKVMTRVDAHKKLIEKNGLAVIPLAINRFSLNPILEIVTFLRILKILRMEKPEVLHSFGVKPILYGSLAGYLCSVQKIINTFLGMGFVFISNKLWVKGLRFIYLLVLKWLMKLTKCIIITQNKDDTKLLTEKLAIKTDKIFTKCSVGVNTKEFHPLKEPSGMITFALVGRMIWDKGIREYVEAAKILRKKSLAVEFFLVGDPDPGNSRSISIEQLRDWDSQGIVKWLGFQNDIKKVWEQTHVAVLPSYREGLSRSLLEAAAYERAIITTDVPGCRELVQDGINGLLVKNGDIYSLVNAMEKLATDKTLREKLAKNARETVLNDYDEMELAKEIIKFY
jgi:glycosyltransferase involved in cell wall biosynthesis